MTEKEQKRRSALRWVKKQILSEPKQFLMSDYFANEEDVQQNSIPDAASKIPNCGTAACIAGWLACKNLGLTPNHARSIESSRLLTGFDARAIAGEELQLNDVDSDLFNVIYWPIKYRHRWDRAKTPVQRAKVACSLIDAILDGEYELTDDGELVEI